MISRTINVTGNGHYLFAGFNLCFLWLYQTGLSHDKKPKGLRRLTVTQTYQSHSLFLELDLLQAFCLCVFSCIASCGIW